MRWLLLNIIVASIFFEVAACSVASTPTRTPDEIELTATHIIVRATETQLALGTPLPPAPFTQTSIALTRAAIDLTITHELDIATRAQMALGTPVPSTQMAETLVALFATRTAIAITRYPRPTHSPTPNTIQLTATALQYEPVITLAFQETTSPPALPLDMDATDPLNLTATAVISGATQTTIALASNPELALSPTFTRTPVPCRLSIVWNRPQTANQIQAAFDEAGIHIDSVEIVLKGIGQAEHCNAPFYPLNGQIAIGVTVEDLSDEAHLTTLIADILAVLSRFPPSEDMYGPEPARLLIGFHIGDVFRIVESDYANALSAYEEGLRGTALVEALGGLLPPFRFPDAD